MERRALGVSRARIKALASACPAGPLGALAMTLNRLVAGNWKMHGLSSDLEEIKEIARQSRDYPTVEVALCLPAALIDRAVRAVPGFPIGAQDVHQAEFGAHTGNISAQMLRDAGASLTIVGHSERREAQRESNSDVRAKAEAALSHDLGVILCVGESGEIRNSGQAVETVAAQLDASLPAKLDDPANLAIAYEPIWAIGTGKVPTPAEIGEMHAALRERLVAAFGDAAGDIRILYGGSVKASNASEIFGVPHVDGALVGGASLKAVDFIPIVAAAVVEGQAIIA
jgi:triosephosphate isomerase